MKWNEAERILLIEPFYTGSHRQWADAIKQHEPAHVELFTLPGRHWKWRMHAAAIQLAHIYSKSTFSPELLIASDMMDLALFKALCGEWLDGIPVHLYMHENQLTYPWSTSDRDVRESRDNHYAFMNYSSALVADEVLFNSRYHLDSFLDSLPDFLRMFPDHQGLATVDHIRKKSRVQYMKLSLNGLLNAERAKNEVPHLLWNHRWEYDKNPEEFFEALTALSRSGKDFKLIVCGREYGSSPSVFSEARKTLDKHIVHWGHAASREEYHGLLLRSDILAVTSHQDFFGISIVEAIAAGVRPLLPDRLSYPELVDLEDLYGPGDLLGRLSDALAHLPTKEETGRSRQSVRRFSY